jgi:hypothetical protein
VREPCMELCEGGGFKVGAGEGAGLELRRLLGLRVGGGGGLLAGGKDELGGLGRGGRHGSSCGEAESVTEAVMVAH